jgi:hypothetical protein
MLTRVFLNPEWSQEVADMALHMFGAMNQKTENRRRKFSIDPPFEVSVRMRSSMDRITSGQVHLTWNVSNRSLPVSGGNSSFSSLRGWRAGPRQGFAAGIREEPVENASQMLKMKSNRRDPAGRSRGDHPESPPSTRGPSSRACNKACATGCIEPGTPTTAHAANFRQAGSAMCFMFVHDIFVALEITTRYQTLPSIKFCKHRADINPFPLMAVYRRHESTTFNPR